MVCVDRYLVVVVIEGYFVLLVQVVQILGQVPYSELVPPLGMWMLLLVLFLNLIKERGRGRNVRCYFHFLTRFQNSGRNAKCKEHFIKLRSPKV